MKENNNELYMNEGMAIFVKGKMVIGIHPNNLENNLKSLDNGSMGFDWGVIKNNYINQTSDGSVIRYGEGEWNRVQRAFDKVNDENKKYKKFVEALKDVLDI